ncbi:MAG: hypothetical protein ACI8ZN_000407 [Bacteroidia bacterium]|jgi:hypothetical protein
MSLKNEEKDKRSRLFLFLIIGALFLVNGWLIYNLWQKNDKIEVVEKENVDLSAEAEALEVELDKMELQLQDYVGRNKTLDSLISEKDRDIANKVAQIRSLLKNKNISKEQLAQARAEKNNLTGKIAFYTQQVDSLSKLNQFLEDKVYASEQEIMQQKSDRNFLEGELNTANNKVNIASKLKVKNIFATGVKIKNDDTEKDLSKLSRMDRIKVEFTLDNNPIAVHGPKTVYLKILSPSKSPLQDNASGSGKFNFQGEESIFTAKQTFNFSNENEILVFYWNKSNALISGEYEAHIFCEDVIIGTTKFELK